MATKNLLIRGGADFSGIKREMDKAQKHINDFKKNVNRSLASIGTAIATMGVGLYLKDAVKEAMTFQASIQQLGRLMGSNSTDFIKWANTTASSFNMSKSAAVKYGATLSNIISTFATDTKQTQQYTQDLLQATAVAASMTGRTMEDALERIRSGMLGNTEAVEDLGIFVNVAMIESTKAFQKFSNGKSWDQLNFRTQQTIRYFAILEQAAQKYGVEVGNNAVSRTAQLSAKLGNLKLAIGQAFLPIWDAVVPAISAMVTWLTKAANTIAAFTNALFGKAPEKQAQAQTGAISNQADAVGGLGDSYKKAGKEAKKAQGFLAGFDEVNNIPDSDSSGAGLDDVSSGAPATLAGMDMSTQVTSFDNLRDSISGVTSKIKEMAAELKERTKPAFDRLKETFFNVKESLSGFISSPAMVKFFEFMKDKSIDLLNGRLFKLSGLFDQLSGAFDIFNSMINRDFAKGIEGIEKMISGMYDSMVGKLYPFFPEFADKLMKFKKDFSDTWASLKEDITKYGDPAKLEASDFGQYIVDVLKQKWELVKIGTSAAWSEIKSRLADKWKEITGISWGDVKSRLQTEWESLRLSTGVAWDLFKESLSQKWEAIKTTISWDAVKSKVLTSWDELKTSTGNKWTELKQTIGQKWDAINAIDFGTVKTGLINIWNGLKTETTSIWDAMKNNIKQSVNSIIGSINAFIDGFNGISIDVPKVTIPKVGEFGGFSIGMPQIPRLPKLARGGIVDGRTNMGNYIAGEAGSEMIVPLENTSFVDKLASALGTAVMSAMQLNNSGSNNSGDIVIQLEGATLARLLNPHLAKEKQRIGTTLINSR